MTPWDDRTCELGEGPLWHPLRGQLFWFDILGRRLLSRSNGYPEEWRLPEMASAAGWVDESTLLIATETRLATFEIDTGRTRDVVGLEGGGARTRSNDGRADPWGGFWVGTMGKEAEAGAGAIYRYHGRALRRIRGGVTIPNSICFDRDRARAYWCDTTEGRIMMQAVDEDGWPAAEPETFVDLREENLNPDGSVVDANGWLWNAQWGAGRVAAYDARGRLQRAVPVPAPHASCPAFGGDDLTTLFCTTAREHMTEATLMEHPHSGGTYAIPGVAKGLPEPRVIL